MILGSIDLFCLLLWHQIGRAATFMAHLIIRSIVAGLPGFFLSDRFLLSTIHEDMLSDFRGVEPSLLRPGGGDVAPRGSQGDPGVPGHCVSSWGSVGCLYFNHQELIMRSEAETRSRDVALSCQVAGQASGLFFFPLFTLPLSPRLPPGPADRYLVLQQHSCHELHVPGPQRVRDAGQQDAHRHHNPGKFSLHRAPLAVCLQLLM